MYGTLVSNVGLGDFAPLLSAFYLVDRLALNTFVFDDGGPGRPVLWPQAIYQIGESQECL
jgi:hypothetical protein